jgi:hypothetical protein
MLVSKDFNAIVAPVFYRSLEFDMHTWQSIINVLKERNYVKYVKEISFIFDPDVLLESRIVKNCSR